MAKRAATAQRDQLVKLIVGAGQASPSPPVGPALGSKGVKSMDFCKEFNALTGHIVPGTPIPCLITVRPDRSFHFTMRTPPTSTLLLTAAGVKPGKKGKLQGANAPGRTPAQTTPAQSSITTAAPKPRGPSDPAAPGGNATAAVRAGSGTATYFSAGGGVGLGTQILVAKGAGGEKETGKGGGTTQVGEVSLKHVYEIAKIKHTEERLSGMSLEALVKCIVAQARTIGVGVVP